MTPAPDPARLAANDPGPLASNEPGRPWRLGVMGGTFDPIHHGHLVAGSEVAAKFGLDEVVFVPTGTPWQKKNRVVSPAEDRYLMTVIATASNPKFTVSRVDIERPGDTYTVDTLKDLHAQRGTETDLYFITGADALASILTWHGADELSRSWRCPRWRSRRPIAASASRRGCPSGTSSRTASCSTSTSGACTVGGRPPNRRNRMPATDHARSITRIAAQAAADKLGTDIVAYDVSERLALTDVFLIVTASNERQVSSVVDGVEEALFKEGVKVKRREGDREARWVLLDFGDLVLHAQHTDERHLYSLDRLWRDCPAIPLQLDVAPAREAVGE